ncbi:MAG TPA: MarR family transcriptional regulator [Polyangiales bacterium]|nr:MarR family transcriptional regulator [Polyangiales bacterium]
MVVNQVDPAALEVLQLAFFAGVAANQQVRAALEAKGFAGLREAHGYIVQHLLASPRSVGELARLLGISQQAVSKSIAELARNRYVEDAPSPDARVRKLRLSRRGKAAVQAARELRRAQEQALIAHTGEEQYRQARQVLLAALEALGALDAVRERKLRP